MDAVTVLYHREPDGTWWAESEQLVGFTAVAATRAEIREVPRSGVAFHLNVGVDSIELDERFDESDRVDVQWTGIELEVGWTGSLSQAVRSTDNPSRAASEVLARSPQAASA